MAARLRRLLSTSLLMSCACAFTWLPFSLPSFALENATEIGPLNSEADQAVDILGVRRQIERLKELEANTKEEPEEALLVRSSIVGKILRAVLEVRQACNKIDRELAYAYDIRQKEERRERFMFELFNLANFAQLSTFYTLEPFVRIHLQFVTSAVFTTTSGSLGTAISTASRVYGAKAKASHVAPPKVLAGMVDGKPVDATGLPPILTKFLDSRSPSGKTRREELFAMWQSRWQVDASKQENLCGIASRDKASIGYLSSRILLLWSLHTCLQEFDHYLLSLLKVIKRPDPDAAMVSGMESGSSSAVDAGILAAQGLAPSAIQAAKLLKIEPQLAALIDLQKKKAATKTRDELELFVLERTLEGTLDIQVACNKIDEELNYNYDVVLADLLRERAKWLQYNYNLNFLQSGILGIVAGRLYLSRLSFAGDQQFVISGSNGTALTLLAMMQMHGFWRKVDREPNSLAEVLNLHPEAQYRFSPLVSAFLNSSLPGSTDGKTRIELFNEVWRKFNVTTVNLNRQKTKQALAAMPTHKWDTIKIVSNRIVLLHSLKKDLESFQGDMLALLKSSEPGR